MCSDVSCCECVELVESVCCCSSVNSGCCSVCVDSVIVSVVVCEVELERGCSLCVCFEVECVS